MDTKTTFQWIDNDIDISTFYEKLPSHIKQMIAEAEEADRNNQDAIYDTICDDLEIHTKLLIPDVISSKEWDIICCKYAIR